MARRKREEEHENHERWLVSYADFITLLFAFFVVMYSISSINDGKYRVLSDSISHAFSNPRGSIVPPVQVVQPMPERSIKPLGDPAAGEEEKKKRLREKMKSVARDVSEVLEPLVKSGKVRVLETSRGISIEINDSILFSPGQAVLALPAVTAMRSVAEVVAQGEFPITIEGHTDNIPIKTAQFPSNWELSAVRATTVLRLFNDAGVKAERLTAIGYGDQRPVEKNDAAEGRARNRRVNILIDATEPELAQEIR